MPTTAAPPLRLGRINGVPIELHLGFFLTALLLSFHYWRSFRVLDIGLALAIITILFGSVLAHELAHASAARKFNVRTFLIELNMFGGLAHFDRPARTTRQNCTILFAGPLANLALALVAFALFQLLMWTQPVETVEVGGYILHDVPRSEIFVVRVLRLATYINAGLFVVNLLPGFPLDGGRIVYLLLADRWSSRTATLIVGLLGVFFSCFTMLLFLGTLLSGFPIWAPPEFRPNWNAVQDPDRVDPWA
jgi:stage IV sporulation protein FB